ncbi:fimbrial biogenesis outer membrane usher protein [Pseudomonas proteolytica]|uniref:fimbria/pilus outer membrane usher protein n=1 Tax=Pseudomonas proteolytica TaxID=219574 RepID=UPI0023DEF8B4|nr:fimbria/pilus outer membrane usher protein [Pseudomonas proteolytica]MDF3162815.1 fimbrial biogenesis outer membrane usher protein [Pseudomonas proteolytica]
MTLICGVLLMPQGMAEEVQFNEDFLPIGSSGINLDLYQTGNPVMTGEYRADILVNSTLSGRQDIRIVSDEQGRKPRVCVDTRLLELIGVNVAMLSPSALSKLSVQEPCAFIDELIEGASAFFSTDTQQLDFSIPQVAMRRNARGYVSPALWDRGVNSAMLGYDFNANRNKTRFANNDSAYLGLNAGLNLGGWRLRHNGSLSWESLSGSAYQKINTFAQRDLTALKSQLTVGEANTSGEIFDTLAYRGIEVASDDRMLPDALRGYAPIVRGIARTNARVTVSQGGNLLMQTTVSPGAFAIDDLYATGYGGDLLVTVVEADGTQQNFIVPYASVNQLLRPGTSRFSLTVGETRNYYVDEQVRLLQGTFQYGMANALTSFTGAQASEGYMAVLGGLAFGTPIGAMAVDVTHARTSLIAGNEQGQSLRLSYSKNIQSTGSNFSLAAYRFSTQGYLDFSNALMIRDAQQNGADTALFGRPRSRLTLSVDQSLEDWGHLSLSGFTQNYWSRPGQDVQYQMGYSKQLRRVNFGVNISRSRAGQGDMQNTLLFTASMPLELGASYNSPQLSARVGRDSQGHYSQQASLSGGAGEDREYGYSLTAGRDGANRSTSTSASAQYQGPKARINGTLSQGDGYTSASLGGGGTIVAHPLGMTLTPYSGETMAVINAPGAAGAKVVGYPGLRLDGKGTAVVSYLQPYQLNEIAIDPEGTDQRVELNETSQQIAPRAGAVVAVDFTTVRGEALLLNVRLHDQSPLPFGAAVVDEAGNSVGTVGQGGQLYARVKEGTQRLQVNWGSESDQVCTLKVPDLKVQGQIYKGSTLCLDDAVLTDVSDSALHKSAGR